MREGTQIEIDLHLKDRSNSDTKMFQSHYSPDEDGSRANFLMTGMQEQLQQTAHKTGHFNVPLYETAGRRSPFMGNGQQSD